MKKFFGLGFSDEIVKTKISFGHFKNPKEEPWQDSLIPNFDPQLQNLKVTSWRLFLLIILTIIIFFILFLRLFHLQITTGAHNRILADTNRIKIKVIHAQRGVIFDRNGELLALNSPGFRLTEDGKTKLISREDALKIEVSNPEKGKDLEVDSLRLYPKGLETAHVLGYVGEISEDQLSLQQYKTYKLGDRIGQSGVEFVFEETLRGKDGGEIIEVDAKGEKLRTLRQVEPQPGKNLYLAIDLDLQSKLFLELEKEIKKTGSCCGAAIVSNPLTGEILALISIPSFDNNIFTLKQEAEINELFQREDSPILNRALAGMYPPGSIFKIVSAIAALSSGKISADTEVLDTGEIFLGSFRFTNWYFTQYGKTEGSVDLKKALKRSNDTYFYKVAQIIGEEVLIDWSKKLKLGSKIGIDLPGEEGGLVPDDKWKREKFGEGWYPGDTLHLSIGQGFLLLTPLQIQNLTSFIAADGILYKPHVAKQFLAEKVLQKQVSTGYIKVIKEGLLEVAKNGGTAWPLFNFPIETGGKTGTAEYGDAKGRTHAWYTGFAPADDPKIVVTVLIEGGGEGSSVAAPVAKEIFRYYFSPDKNNLIKDIYPVASDSAKTLGE